MANKTQTILKLRRLAQGSGHEAETAQAILKELQELHPSASAAADDAEEPEDYHVFNARNWHDRNLLVSLAYYLGCAPLTRRDMPGKLLFRGPKSLVAAAPAIYKTLAKRLADLHRGTTVGFLIGALPSEPPADQAGKSDGKKETLSEEALEAARTALRIGRSAQPRRQLAASGT